ncbi:unnamed protein product [Rhizophagus irregularis]|nr:unnamed protein product [Rhizophagus irregularis]
MVSKATTIQFHITKSVTLFTLRISFFILLSQLKKRSPNKKVWKRVSLDERKYSLVLEYADGGTLRDYLRKNTIEWNNQLRFAKEISSAILWLHDKKKIIHGDLHPNNLLIHKDTVKLANFGRSCLKGSGSYNTQVWGNTLCGS